MKHLPPELRDWYFPFNWEVSDIWGLPGKIEQRKTIDLVWHLAEPFWSSVRGNGLLFDLRPIDVLVEPQKNAYHHARIEDADTSFPVSLTSYKETEIIIDGIHRLAKLARNNIETVHVKVISEKSIEKIAKYT